MKNLYLTTLFIFLLGSLFTGKEGFSQALLPDNLAVYRYGNGVDPLVASTAAVFIDEYTQNGVKVQSIAFPVENTGTQYALTGLPKVSTAIPVEGLMTLSADRNHLAVIGYNTGIGKSTGTVGKTIGIVGADGVVNTSTFLSGDRGSPRCAIVNNGTDIWFASTATTNVTNSAGFKYVSSGTVTDHAPKVSFDNSQYRSVLVFNNNLYSTRGNANFYKVSGLPKVAVDAISTYSLPGSTAVAQIVLFDTNEDNIPDLLYAADDSSTGYIWKYTSVDGEVWEPKGNVTKDGLTNGIKSITGKMIAGVVTLYGTTTGTFDGNVKSSLFKITDSNPLTEILDAEPVKLADAPAEMMFRAVAFTPQSQILPVKWTSFKAESKGTYVSLNWETASETNNSHFEIFRANQSNTFNKIGTVKGKGNSNGRNVYTFSDFQPETGMNYYKIKQVDHNGQSEESKVLSVPVSLKKDGFKVSSAGSDLILFLENAVEGQGVFSVFSLDGKLLIKHDLKLQRGANKLSVPHNFAPGIYIGSIVNAQNEVERVKFSVR